MVGHEPAHLMGVVVACPRPSCRSLHVKCYYNNHKRSQPRYRCLGCKFFRFGGKLRQSKKEKRSSLVRAAVKKKGPRIKITTAAKIRQSKEKKYAAPREDHAGGTGVKKKGLRIKITPAESEASSYRRPVKELQVMMELLSMKSKISSPNDLSVQPASPISKPKRLRRGRGPFALSNCISIGVPNGSSHEEYQADAGADMNSPVPHSNVTVISPPDSSSGEKDQVDAGAGMSSLADFVGFEEMVGELVEMLGCSELVALESKLDDDVGLGSGAGAPDEFQLGALKDGGPAFSCTSSEQLRGPVDRSVGPSEPELLDWEEELLLVDAGLSGLTLWVDTSME